MKIQDLSQKTDLQTYTIRYYEKEGLLGHQHVTRERNNYRNYSESAIDRLKLIKKFQKVGYSLTEIKEILSDVDQNSVDNQEAIDRIANKIQDIEAKKQEYEQMLVMLNAMLTYRLSLDEN
ncbi:hypothetical protein X560_0234 [Listeria fleischmannii 1991]|uniref:Mercuric resistance operon regulatory protein n=2 Tax=Listeria fleischmannii TaxID=1069827 RepID=A0A2X3GS71_9LIST|nr:MerR family transcriptional regulator [Listeria fleischmannii]EMG28899.1 MerR family transcriptional regulator [Listeria fleischmannii subsp. fleischmannii LU2006-1]KMT61167.1 hypothetical protein X560_0234 [Listeria fleischmannii 1991]SQC64996.1 Mercuric resistance operon regulatory protein [Listeria fleischmannii subsp. fleischmannii]